MPNFWELLLMNLKKFTYFIGILCGIILFASCTRNLNHLVPVGGYCGKSTENFENPYSNDNIDEEMFSVIESVDFEDLKAVIEAQALEREAQAIATGKTVEPVVIPNNRKYRANSVSILFKAEANPTPQDESEKYVPDEQIMYTHHPVYQFGAISLNTFNKTCSRGLTQESKLSFETVLPTEIILNDDISWQATHSLNYKLDFSKELQPEGFVVTKVEEVADPATADPADFNFSDYVFLEQIGKLTKDQKKFKSDPAKVLDEIYMQIKVSDTIYARIVFHKYDESSVEE